MTLTSLLRGIRASRASRRAAWVAALALAIAWPTVANSDFLVVVGTMALTFAVLGQSLNLVYGYAGYLCMSITVFWATGGYVAAHLTLLDGVTPQLAIPIGGIAAGVIAFLFGLVTMTRGRNAFAILSLVLLVFASTLANNWASFTGGAQGLIGLPAVQVGPASWNITLVDDQDFYYTTLGVTVVSMLILMALVTSRWGRTLRATNVDESLAASFGIHLLRERVRAMTIAGLLSGLIGGVYVFSVTLADPSLVATTYLAPLFAMLFLAGPGNFGGVALSSIVVTFLPQLTRSFQDQSNTVYGVLLVALCLLFPDGLPAAVRQAARWLPGRAGTAASSRDGGPGGPRGEDGLGAAEPGAGTQPAGRRQ
jgi:branched-chain amino acid transport system permease protein